MHELIPGIILSHEASRQEFAARLAGRGEGEGEHRSPPAPFPFASCHHPTFPMDCALHPGSTHVPKAQRAVLGLSLPTGRRAGSLPLQGCREVLGNLLDPIKHYEVARKRKERHLHSCIPSTEPVSFCSSSLLGKGMGISSLFHPCPSCWWCFVDPAWCTEGPGGTTFQPWEHVRQHQVSYHSLQICIHVASLLPSAFPSHCSLPCGKRLKSMGVSSP